MDEILDLVDQSDNVIDTISRLETRERKLRDYRVVNLFLVNSAGQLWIPRRTASKACYPLCLDFSMGGYVSSGETYEQALEREAMEELAVDLTKIPYRLLGYLNPHKDDISSWMKVYEAVSDQAPDYNPDDFCEYYWLSPEELLRKLEKGEPAKDDLVKLVRRFYKKV